MKFKLNLSTTLTSLTHSPPSNDIASFLNFLIFAENDTKIIRKKNSLKQPRNFHIIIVRKKKFKRKMKAKRKFSSSFPPFFLPAFCFGFSSPHLKGCQKQAFLANSNTNDTFSRIYGREEEEDVEKNIKPLYSHLNRITSLIVYLPMCVAPQLPLCAF